MLSWSLSVSQKCSTFIAREAVAAILSYMYMAMGSPRTRDLKKSPNFALCSISFVLCSCSTTLRMALMMFWAFSELCTFEISFMFFVDCFSKASTRGSMLESTIAGAH